MPQTSQLKSDLRLNASGYESCFMEIKFGHLYLHGLLE